MLPEIDMNEFTLGNYSVYVHILPKEVSGCKHDKYYFGCTSRPPYKRWGRGSHYHQTKRFYPAIEKYGWDNIKHIVIAEWLSESVAHQMEIELIKKYKTQDEEYGFNISAGGTGVRGIVPYNKGKKCNEAERQKCREARLGKKMSEEAKKKIGESSKKRWQKGGDFYEKYIATGTMPFTRKPTHKFGFENKSSKRVMCIDTKEIFGSACEASRLGYGNFSTICAVCRGEKKSLFNRHFVYVEDYLREHNIEYTDLLKEYTERRA